MKKKPIKYIKIKDKQDFNSTIKYFILKSSNSSIISLGMHHAINKFIKELELIPLSEELQ
jgi:hypothetical protein